MRPTLFTIGHSNRSLDAFMALLRSNEINAVCDVRSTPYSRRYPQYNQKALKETLTSQEIAYIFLGKELGGRPENPDCYDNGTVNYDKVSQTNVFREGLGRIADGLNKGFQPALLCAEKDPLFCHRFILICRRLASFNMDIVHIVDCECRETQQELEQRLLRELKIKPDLFHSNQEDMLRRAYEIHGNKIAFQTKS